MNNQPFSISSRLPDITTNIFTVMSSLAVQHHAVNLGQGFPDYPMSTELMELVNKAMKQGFNQYSHTYGYLPLRERVSEKCELAYGINLHPDKEITVTPGGTYAIYTAITSVIHPGDEVIILEPAYDSYIPNIELNGGKVVGVPLKLPDYRIDFELLENAINDRTRLMVLNSPHNPTGAVFSSEDMKKLELLLEGKDIFIVSDEVYEHVVFDVPHQSVLAYPGLYERSFACFSFGKTFNCTGWKTGYCIAPEYLMKEFRKVHQFNVFSCFAPVQAALAEFLKTPDNYLSLSGILHKKQKFFEQGMQETAFKPVPTHGSYFQIFDYSSISEEGDLEFTKRLVKEYGVAAIPVSAFYRDKTDHRQLRFCFAKKEETLERALEKLIRVG
jgi:methionine aminotransferase